MTKQKHTPGRWDDDYLAHMCSMSSLAVAMIRAPDFDPRDIGDEPLQNIKNMYFILADTYVELQARAGMKPKFKAPVPVKVKRRRKPRGRAAIVKAEGKE